MFIIFLFTDFVFYSPFFSSLHQCWRLSQLQQSHGVRLPCSFLFPDVFLATDAIHSQWAIYFGVKGFLYPLGQPGQTPCVKFI